MGALGVYLCGVIVCLITRTLAQETCSSPLGMESGDIKDGQISCWPSSSCRRARLNTPAYIYSPSAVSHSCVDPVSPLGYLGFGLGWIGYRKYQTTYSQVDLLSVKRLTRVAISGTASYYTKSFRIFYSKDGLLWEAYKPKTNSSFLGLRFPGNVDGSTVIEQYLNPPINIYKSSLSPFTLQPLGSPRMYYTHHLGRQATVALLKCIVLNELIVFGRDIADFVCFGFRT